MSKSIDFIIKHFTKSVMCNEMKKITCIIITLFLAYGCSKGTNSPDTSAAAGRITISGAWALYPMAVTWAAEYQKKYPDVVIDISAGGAGKGMTDALTGTVDLGMVSREINNAEIQKGAWWISVVKDAVIPVMNEKNPLRDEIKKRGLTKNEFNQIWISGKITTWNIFVSSETRYPIHVYTRSDACGASETWAKYVGGMQEDLKGAGVYGDPGLADAVRNDIIGIGYNNVNFAYDGKTKKPIAGIIPIPIDMNASGRIEPDENFYTDRDSLMKAIAENKYPSPPARNLHLVSRGIPGKKQVIQFLLWVLGEGQQFVPEAGYIRIPGEQLKKQADLLLKKK
jgi:phosphate transport system substrate-binding protein